MQEHSLFYLSTQTVYTKRRERVKDDSYQELKNGDDAFYVNEEDKINYEFYNKNIRAHREFFVSQHIVSDIFSKLGKQYQKLAKHSLLVIVIK